MARDIGEWLKDLGLGRYKEAFAKNEIDFDALPYITDDDLKDIDVALGARRKLLAAIAALSEGKAEATSVTGTATTETALVPSSEQRQVTVLFADLAGFTELSSELGAEATHELLNRYFESVDGIIRRYGGSIDKHMGDNVMAVFGAPVAHTDDPARAARAALDVHQAMSLLSEEFGRPLSTHIGLASGQVVASGTGSEVHHEYTVTGSSVNLASRLQDKAEAGQTLVSQAVQLAIADLAKSAPLGEIAVKGFGAPVPVWRLEGLRDDAEFVRYGPFVGRRGEQRQFGALIQDCIESDAGQSILVRGEAGIGKTRLIEEFALLAEAEGFAAHKGLVLDFGVGKGQDAVRALVRSLLGLAGGGGKAQRAAAANRAVEASWVDTDAGVFLNDLLDLPQPLEWRALYDAMDNATRNQGKEAVVAKLVRGAGKTCPILITVEDIHWANSLTLAHLAAIAATVAHCPAVLVMTSRVEGDPLDQAWRASLGGSPLTTMDLQPLRAREAEELARGFVEPGSAVMRDCIARAEGNPLFLEQLLRNAEEGALTEIPGSIQSLVLARMDRLAPRDKQALQAASVIGQRFASDTLCALLEDRAYDCRSLIEHHLIRPEGSGYLFAHALIQEGVYSSLLQVQKRALHLRTAGCFADHDTVLYAEHLDRAGDDEAPRAYLDAAQAQAAIYHYERAMQLIDRGLSLAVRPADSFALTCLKGQMLHEQGSIDASIEAYEQALDLAENEKEQCRAWLGLAAGRRILDRYDAALDALDKAGPIARRHRMVRELALLHHVRGNLYFPMGRIEDCLAEHEKSLKFARESGSAEAEAHALSGLADASYAAGRMASAHRYFSDCVEVARLNGFGRIEVTNRSMIGFVGVFMLRIGEALDYSTATVDAARKVGDQRAEMLGEMLAVYALLEMAEFARARQHNARAWALTQQLGMPRFEAQAFMYDGRLAHEEGQGKEAVEKVEKALKISAEVGHSFTGPRVAGMLARCLHEPQAKRAALTEGERMLQAGSVSHNYLFFYPDAIEVSLEIGDWDEVERYAGALEEFARAERLPWREFYAALGRVLAAWGRGQRDPENAAEMKRLRDEAALVGFKRILPIFDEALEIA